MASGLKIGAFKSLWTDGMFDSLVSQRDDFTPEEFQNALCDSIIEICESWGDKDKSYGPSNLIQRLYGQGLIDEHTARYCDAEINDWTW